jgi:hypothetical protein
MSRADKRKRLPKLLSIALLEKLVAICVKIDPVTVRNHEMWRLRHISYGAATHHKSHPA